MNALPFIAPAMTATTATSTQGGGKGDSGFQLELDGLTTRSATAGEQTAVDGGRTLRASQPSAPGMDRLEQTGSVPQPSEALSLEEGSPVPMSDAPPTTTEKEPEAESGSETTSLDIAPLSQLFTLTTLSPVESESLPPAALSDGQENEVIVPESSSPGASQAVLQLLENMLARGAANPTKTSTATAQTQLPASESSPQQAAPSNSATQQQNSVPWQQVTVLQVATTQTTMPAEGASASSASNNAASLVVSPTVPQVSGQMNASLTQTAAPTGQAASSSTVATLSQQQESTPAQSAQQTTAAATTPPQNPSLTQTAVPTRQAASSSTVATLSQQQESTPAQSAQQTTAAATTPPQISLAEPEHPLSSQQLSSLSSLEGAEPDAAQSDFSSDTPDQDKAGLNAGEGSSAPAKMTDTLDNGSLFRAELNAGLKGDSVAGQPTVANAPAGFSLSEEHILQQVLDRFALNRRIESGSISLRLHPEELGELKLDVLVQRTTVQVQVTAQNPQVQELLERHLPRLREALAQQGFSLDRMEISLADSTQGDLPRQDDPAQSRYFNTTTSSPSNWFSASNNASETDIVLPLESGASGLNIHI